MLLGKRPRPSMRRTTSMSGFSVDLNTTTTVENPNPNPNPNPSPTALDVNGNNPNKDRLKQVGVGVVHPHEGSGGGGGGLIRRNTIGGDQDGFDQRLLTSYSPRNHRRSSGDYGEKEMASFLRICGLCKRRLAPGRDIFMYRGDTAFCSQECRQQQMNHDDKKEKCSTWVSKKESSRTSPATMATTTTTATTMPMATESTSNGETAVAA